MIFQKKSEHSFLPTTYWLMICYNSEKPDEPDFQVDFGFENDPFT